MKSSTVSRLLFWISLTLFGISACSGSKNEQAEETEKDETIESISPSGGVVSDSVSLLPNLSDSTKSKKYQELDTGGFVAPDHKPPK